MADPKQPAAGKQLTKTGKERKPRIVDPLDAEIMASARKRVKLNKMTRGMNSDDRLALAKHLLNGFSGDELDQVIGAAESVRSKGEGDTAGQ